MATMFTETVDRCLQKVYNIGGKFQSTGKERLIMKEKIERLKKEKNAVILTHYYAP